MSGKTRLRAIINRLRKHLREHGCRCCQTNYAWLTAISFKHKDDARMLFTAIVVVRDAYQRYVPVCRCCQLNYARTTAELFTYCQGDRVVSATG